MNQPVDLDRSKYELALKKWQADCRQRMAQRYPTIPFDADRWPLKGVSVIGLPNFSFTPYLVDFADKHPSFAEAFHCLIAEIVLGEKLKGIANYADQLRLLRLALQAACLISITPPCDPLKRPYSSAPATILRLPRAH